MKSIAINFKNALSREEMRHVNGGKAPEGSCGYSYYNSTWGATVYKCGVDKSTATSTASANSGHWCCDSCGTSSYCGSGGAA